MANHISNSQIAQIAQDYATPCWAYDAATIRAQIARLKQFDVIRFAQKAASNIHLLRLMREQGVLVDAVSLGEVERALAAGYVPGSDQVHAPIVFTADLLDRHALKRVVELNIPVNCGSPQMLEQLGQAHPGHQVWLRINPGFGHGHSRKTNTGGEQSKHGIWFEELPAALRLIDQYGLQLHGLHMHIGSGVDYDHLQSVCDAMIAQVNTAGRDLRAISIGGGLSIPYQSGEAEVDTAHYFAMWEQARRRIEEHLGHRISMEIEPGRFLVAQSGLLISELRAQKQVGSNFFSFVDAGFNDLARPAMYGSFHRISAHAPDGTPRSNTLRATVVAGPLCESGDVFTQEEGGVVSSQALPSCEIGDLFVFHDAGAYGSSMSSNYNSRPLIPEVLVDGAQITQIRRRQTVQELIALEL
ncbi:MULTISPECIES: diaminopimelate decarboxylase [unclassified Undibacterium]|uniref:diaminopimelate decarboxylase n=1 Tax=unclassified Undibacterium TaxID=2630295 RepID=UPI002AC89879|nr:MULTISPECIES: diaminopimelate decarboxylase [unclassified Undibacterium]MEB0137437.1 diaminopimelate decarboxylase [Undibacterium sp. CCC2.1]MEB0170898.1 diaminopimelate decarboxylase [Undibacterium sp. CCC1.1]MEB0174850.1 diaminopimelate decarboxylase [Undibacterium sp. CCC3.4]MEB0214186.1 diaminopimelate decarboxylase [Undibacterium sp. 5I2]WPX44497.1 diaminopimelate decarboxylase [Undibacterium sp. CCC3.4]